MAAYRDRATAGSGHWKGLSCSQNTPIPACQDGGFFDIAIDPNYKRTAGPTFVFGCGAAAAAARRSQSVARQWAPAPLSMTRWVRGRINANNEWVDQKR
jgi:hypothetical protein